MKLLTTTEIRRVFRMISIDGFIAIFWEEIRTAGASGENITQREAFDRINDEYFAASGVYRYSSFESFKMAKDRKK